MTCACHPVPRLLPGRAKRAEEFWGPKREPGSSEKGAGNEAKLDTPKAPKPFEFLVFREKTDCPEGPQNDPKSETRFGAFWDPFDGRAKRAKAKIRLQKQALRGAREARPAEKSWNSDELF